MKYILEIKDIWELGQRQNQEDSLYPAFGEAQKTDRLFILCDGMGGYAAGEVASRIVCESMSESILRDCPDPEGHFSNETFKRALSHAYDEMDKHNQGEESMMGTTMTFLKLHDQGCTIAHIGDSRVYHIRPGKEEEDTQILFQTDDHSLVNDWIKLGEITPEEAKNSKQKNVITRAMQPGMERRSKADLYFTYDIHPGDYFFMCSDGMLEQMEDDHLKYIFSSKGGDDAHKVEMLTQVTRENADNHSAIIIHVVDVLDPVPIEKTEETPLPESLLGMVENSDNIEAEENNIEVQVNDIVVEDDNINCSEVRPLGLQRSECRVENEGVREGEDIDTLNKAIHKAGKTEGIWLRFALSILALLCALGIAYAFYKFLE